MATIQEVLDGLNDHIPTLPPKVAELVGGGDDLKKLADEVLDDFEKVDGEAKELFERIEDAVDELDKEHENQRQQLTAAIDDLENAALETMEKKLEASRGELEQTVDKLKRQFSALHETIMDGSGELIGRADDLNQGMEAVGAMINTTKSKLTEALGAAKAEMETLDTKVWDAWQTHQTGDPARPDAENWGVWSKKNELLKQASSKIEEMLGDANEAQEALGGSLTEVLQSVIRSQAQEIVNEVSQKVKKEMLPTLDEAMRGVDEARLGLGRSIFASWNGQARARGALQPLFDQVEALMNPIETALNAVKEAAKLVGVDFE